MDRESVREARDLFLEREEDGGDQDEHLIVIELLGRDYEASEIFTAWFWKNADRILPVVEGTPDTVEGCIEKFEEFIDEEERS